MNIKESYTIVKILEDNGMDKHKYPKVFKEADYLDNEMPKSLSLKSKVKIAKSLMVISSVI